MNIVNALTAPESPNPHGISARELLSTEHAQVVMVTLQPGEALKLHLTPVDVFFYVLEGEGVVEIGGEQQTVARDVLVESPARIPHRLLNESEAVFRCLVVKTPRPTESTRIL
ncbi:MAG TPA: cupin domain-containing protein [Chloroflexi bacterium]|nr:cupin domain-containing protein [Chloroflexota bacterium]